MTDHAKNADGLLYSSSQASVTSPEGAIMYALHAQVHATLALAQEQRTRNLIALFQVTDDDADDFIAEGISYLDILKEIREGLGL